MLTDKELDDWASAYVVAEQLPDNVKHNSPHWWAIERFMNLREAIQAEDAWITILEILNRQPPPQVTGMLAAGPLEDLIGGWGEIFIERIELEASRNPAFRHLLGGVWQSSTPDIWARVEKARGFPW